jgi:hypothetical protein
MAPERRYLAQLRALHAQGRFHGGRVYNVEVLHDRVCPRPRGGECTCPSLELLVDGVRMEVGSP